MNKERNVPIMAMTVIATVTGIYTWTKVFPNHLRQLGATESQIGLAYLFLSQANRIPAIFGGFIADHFGRKRILVIATLLMAPLYALTGVMTTWTGAVATLAACYVIGALQWPALLSTVSDSVPEERRGRAIGLLETCFMIAITAGPFIGATVMDAVGDFRRSVTILLFATSAGYVLAGLARGGFLHETQMKRDRFTLAGAHMGWILFIAPVGILVVATDLLSFDGPFFALYGKDVIGLNESAINRASFYGGLVALGTALVGGRVVDRVGSARVLVVSFLALFACLVPFAWAWKTGIPLGSREPRLDYWLYVAMFGPAELFTIAYQKLQTSLAPQEHRALHVGIAATATGIFAPFANLAGGQIYQSSGPSAPFALGAACAAAGTVLSLLLAWELRGRRI